MAHAELATVILCLNWYVEPHRPKRGNGQSVRPKSRASRSGDGGGTCFIGIRKAPLRPRLGLCERELRKAIQLKPGNQVAHRCTLTVCRLWAA